MRITTHIAYAPRPVPIPARYSPTAKHASKGPAWSDQEDARLRDLWDAGLTCRCIAAKMTGRNRNGIIGRAHRLGLERRCSPVKRRN